MKAYEQTLSYLNTLNLRGEATSLDEMIHDAEIGKVSYLTFLNTIFTTEISYRVKRHVERNMVGAPLTDAFINVGALKSLDKLNILFLASA